MRRGQHTVKAQWNNRVAMYTGDFIFARALKYVTTIENPRVHEILARTMVEIVNGEVIQIEDKFRLDQNIKDYFRRIKRKTALLIESSCELGAVVAEVDSKNVIHLKRFGYFVGMSFQIVDDILDFTSTDKQLGKPAGSDLLQGNMTLPILLMKDDPTIVKFIERASVGEITEEERFEMLDIVRKSPAIKESIRISNEYVKKARVFDTKDGNLNVLSLMILLENFDELTLIKGLNIIEVQLDKAFYTLSYVIKLLKKYQIEVTLSSTNKTSII